jgi:hypothetical protein
METWLYQDVLSRPYSQLGSQYIAQTGIITLWEEKNVGVQYVTLLTTHGVIVITYRNSSPFSHLTWNTSQSIADRITSQEKSLWL